MNNYESELINNKKQQLSKEFYAKMEEMKQNINLFANTNLNEDTSKDMMAYLVVENAKLQQENQQLKKQKDDVVELCNKLVIKAENELYIKELLKRNNQLQSNWNSLREFVNDWIEDLENQRESVEGTDLFENHTLVILDDIKTRMNELEGVSDE